MAIRFTLFVRPPTFPLRSSGTSALFPPNPDGLPAADVPLPPSGREACNVGLEGSRGPARRGTPVPNGQVSWAWRGLDISGWTHLREPGIAAKASNPWRSMKTFHGCRHAVGIQGCGDSPHGGWSSRSSLGGRVPFDAGHAMPLWLRKFSTMARPSGVSTDSGWNCMPWTSYSRWRRAMICLSGLVAVTSRQAGRPSPDTTHEW